MPSLSPLLFTDNQHFMAVANSSAPPSLLFNMPLILSVCLQVCLCLCLLWTLFFDFAIIYCSAPLALCATQFDITWGGLLSDYTYLPLQFQESNFDSCALPLSHSL